MTRAMRMAYVIAHRSDYTDSELLKIADEWRFVNPELAWQWREARAIRCVEGKEVDVGAD